VISVTLANRLLINQVRCWFSFLELAPMKKMVLFACAFLATVCASAQPVTGYPYQDFLPMGSGRSVPLPDGSWQLTLSTTLYQGQQEAFVLKNARAEALVPFIVVRQSTERRKWGDTPCVKEAENAAAFMVNTHKTESSAALNKCSRLFPLVSLEKFLKNRLWEGAEYWKDLIPGLVDPGNVKKNQELLLAQIKVQAQNDLYVEVNLFIAPPKGVSPAVFRQNYVAGNLSLEHQILDKWLSIYVDLAEKAFFKKSPQTLIALSYPVVAESTVVAVAPAPANPDELLPARVAQPSTAMTKPAVSTTSVANADLAKLEAERKTLEGEKKVLAAQLEKMQLMMAQLEKSNAEAARIAQAAPVPAAAKQTAPQVFANRKALVIGNDRYTDVSPLNNAGADAEAMAKALAEVGYKVTKHLNLNEKAFKAALRDFRQQVEGGDEVLFFYAGHGVQLANANYLLPIDIKGENEEQVKDDAIQLQRFLDDMQDKKTKFALAVIDACRDNPFKGNGRSVGTRGMAPTSAATGQMVMFSAGSGQQALDKLGPKDVDKNGLFTRIFVKEMLKSGISVDRVLRNVRNQVVEQAKSVGHEQTPALYDQSIGEFYFLN
jgi:hypothetical protein